MLFRLFLIIPSSLVPLFHHFPSPIPSPCLTSHGVHTGCSPLAGSSASVSPWLPATRQLPSLFHVFPPKFPSVLVPVASSLSLGTPKADVCLPCRAGGMAEPGARFPGVICKVQVVITHYSRTISAGSVMQ